MQGGMSAGATVSGPLLIPAWPVQRRPCISFSAWWHFMHSLYLIWTYLSCCVAFHNASPSLGPFLQCVFLFIYLFKAVCRLPFPLRLSRKFPSNMKKPAGASGNGVQPPKCMFPLEGEPKRVTARDVFPIQSYSNENKLMKTQTVSKMSRVIDNEWKRNKWRTFFCTSLMSRWLLCECNPKQSCSLLNPLNSMALEQWDCVLDCTIRSHVCFHFAMQTLVSV